MVKKNCDTLHGSRLRPNANDSGLQLLWAALSGQSASPKLDVVFFPNCRQNAELIAPLHRQTTPLPQPKCLSTLSCYLSDTSTNLRYKLCFRDSVHTCCIYCDGFKPKENPKRPILPALSLLGLPRCMPY